MTLSRSTPSYTLERPGPELISRFPDALDHALNTLAAAASSNVIADLAAATWPRVQRKAVGKSARLLRQGDRVALADLQPHREHLPGIGTTAQVSWTHTNSEDHTTVVSDHGTFLISGSRLLIVDHPRETEL